ncbi:MAG: Smr/MutS family protein [Pseudomonadota bacterium]
MPQNITESYQQAPLPAGPAPVASGQTPACADQQTLMVLELPQLLERVASRAMSPLGAALARRLRPSAEMSTVSRRLGRLSQLRALISENGSPGLEGLEDLSPMFSRLAVDGAYLVPEELEVVCDFLGAVGSAAAFLEPSSERFDELYRLYNRLTPLPELARRVRQVVGPGHSVASGASPLLARLRRDLHHTRDRLRSQLSALVGRDDLSSVFSDQIVTQRADRYVVPVKTDAKGRLAGIVHDYSGTGATCFVEPLEAVEGNNQLALLRRQEREEEERILREVARDLAGNLQALREDLQALAQLDCLLAQASFCQRLDCSEPQINSQGLIDLEKARHPLLAWRSGQGRGRAAPIDVALGGERRELVVSGANAGGKTATLKTVGLLTLMAMCGLHVPARAGSRLAVFGQVMAELGDEQDLDQDKSTFTAHAGRLAWMVGRAGRGSLVLIDELGGGTDPSEGAALGIAVLDWLKDHGATVLCTTHFQRLKAYAALTKGVENVSVAFDTATGRPTYQLHYGLPGFSDALTVSRGLGFPPELIARAEAQLDQSEGQAVALMRQVHEARQRAEADGAAAQTDRLAASQERQEARRLIKQAQQERAGALSEGKRRVREVAKRLEERLEALYQEAQAAQEAQEPPKSGKLKQELYQARREALSQVDQAAGLQTAPEPPPRANADPRLLKAGQAVELTSLGQRGVLLEDPRPGAENVAVSVGVAGVRVLVPLREMVPLPAGQKPEAPRREVQVLASAGDGLDLNIVGLTVEDALPRVDKALDQAILAGKPHLAVVHGVGTGRLRAAVREYLDHHPYVTSTHKAEGRRGGNGVTVAELRD